MAISPKTIFVVIRCPEEGLDFDTDWEKEITKEMVDFMLYGKQYPYLFEKKGLVSFLWTSNLTYMCELIHIFLFNIVMLMRIQKLPKYIDL